MQILRSTWHTLKRVLKKVHHKDTKSRRITKGVNFASGKKSCPFVSWRLGGKFYRFSAVFIFFLCACIYASANLVFAQSVDEGKAIFQKLCVACHTIGEGKKVGPDLKGVTERRDISWLKGYIQSPSSYFKKKDPIATALLKEYKVPMPDPGLKEEEVESVIAFLKGSDPDKMALGTPSQYGPTLAISVGGVIVLTLIGLVAGTKKVEVR